MSPFRFGVCSSICVLLLLPVVAAAQPDLNFDPDSDEFGRGYKLAPNVILHASAGVHTAYTNNVFFEEDEETDSGILRFLVKLWVQSEHSAEEGAILDRKLVKYNVGLSFHYDDYLADNNAVDSQSGFDLGVGLLGGIGASFREHERLSFYFTDTYVRDRRPPNFETSGTLVRGINRFKAGARWDSRSTLSGELSYTNTIDVFENDDLDFANRMRHLFALRGNWQYLPSSRAFAVVSQGINHHAFGDNELMGTRYKVTSYPLSARVGTETHLTERSTASAYAGWTVGFYEEGADYNAPIAGAKYGYRYSPHGRLTLRVDRRFEDSINANYYGEWRAAALIDQQLERLKLAAAAGYSRRTYEGIPDQIMTDTDKRDDHVYTATAKLSFVVRRWWGISAGYNLETVDTEFRYRPSTTSPLFDDPGYLRHHVYVGTSVVY